LPPTIDFALFQIDENFIAAQNTAIDTDTNPFASMVVLNDDGEFRPTFEEFKMPANNFPDIEEVT
jgi:hypothetical protein